MINKIKEFWDSLPKEVKVSVYIVVSYLIGLLLTTLSGLKVDNVIVTAVINILIVFLEETRHRVINRKKK